MKIETGEKWVICGGSSGLGQAFSRLVRAEHPEVQQVLISRRSEVSADFSKIDEWPQALALIEGFAPTRLFYFAGGGPQGSYFDKKWSSHEWTFRVNFLFPAYLLSHLKVSSLKQALFVGSAVSEAKAEAEAASYAAAKHALRGLILSLQADKGLGLDLRLLSPGYLDTPFLPQDAWPRQTPGSLKTPHDVAASTLSWVQDVQGANGHFTLG